MTLIESLVYAHCDMQTCLKMSRTYEATLWRRKYPMVMRIEMDKVYILNYDYGFCLYQEKGEEMVLHARYKDASAMIQFLLSIYSGYIKIAFLGDCVVPVMEYKTEFWISDWFMSFLEPSLNDQLTSLVTRYTETLYIKPFHYDYGQYLILLQIDGVYVLLHNGEMGISSYHLGFLLSLLGNTGVFLTDIYCYCQGKHYDFYLATDIDAFEAFCARNAKHTIWMDFMPIDKPSALPYPLIKQSFT